ncbi:MAG: ABC transporter substrate-binding protein [SAR86 cluster bacterium]|jgi:phospholipid transport system substrate-binding protein|nr:ABC transporter substrate-binding protein [SAR86 cluster bacterium]|tara:strand:+ start:1484 stop:2089 length:606 start_codon:yes stop_codon:yes gene_type:complete
MRPLFSSFSLLFFSSLFFFNQSFAESSSEYVEKIHEDIVLVVRAKQDIYEENPEEFIKAISFALQPLVDFKRISRNVMGRYYKDANKEQIEKFNKVFKASLLETYSKTLAEFKDEEILVSSEVKKSPKGNREKVSLQIVTSTKVYPAIYDMYLNKQGQWKLINIVINGVNLGLTFRNQFYSLMEKEGNNLDVVIERWVTSI